MTQLIKYDTGLNHQAELNWLHFAEIKTLTESQTQLTHIPVYAFYFPQIKPTL